MRIVAKAAASGTLVLAAVGAAAQSPQVAKPVSADSVTFFGIVDLALSYGTGSIASLTQLASGRSSTSRWGVRGYEDLGGGLAAGFWLEGQINADTGGTGTSNFNNQPDGTINALFGRRSTVSLIDLWGELRLGRDFTSLFRNRDDVDPFSTTGVGANLADVLSIDGPTATRASNMVGYFLPPSLGGFFGEAQYFMGENTNVSGLPNVNGLLNVNADDGDGYAGRVGWASGGLAVAVAGSRTRFARTVTSGDIDAYSIAASYDFQVVKLSAGYYHDEVKQLLPLTATGYLVGAVVPLGLTQFKMSYSSYGTDAAGDPRADKIAAGVVYSFSKRTSAYGTYAYLRNRGGASYTLNGSITAPDSHSSGFDIGLKHSF
ncbi:porin [Variovorax sp. J22P168]|uniref:porin n=1 Tax=Variovorax jilinensis TaxID=3053513 RepID=UPI002576B628|nr:porin [Variovorax sp. J22P168]MDM0015373.1 porin [Variovorax sp. J22P168]